MLDYTTNRQCGADFALWLVDALESMAFRVVLVAIELGLVHLDEITNRWQ
jgi:hypothetical protein